MTGGSTYSYEISPGDLTSVRMSIKLAHLVRVAYSERGGTWRFFHAGPWILQ